MAAQGRAGAPAPSREGVPCAWNPRGGARMVSAVTSEGDDAGVARWRPVAAAARSSSRRSASATAVAGSAGSAPRGTTVADASSPTGVAGRPVRRRFRTGRVQAAARGSPSVWRAGRRFSFFPGLRPFPVGAIIFLTLRDRLADFSQGDGFLAGGRRLERARGAGPGPRSAAKLPAHSRGRDMTLLPDGQNRWNGGRFP